MNQENMTPLTPLDVIACGSRLQMMKALVPYLSQKSQKSFAIFIKVLEIQNLASFFDQAPELAAADLKEKPSSPMEILKEISGYAFPADQDRLNQSLKLFETVQMMQALNGGADSETLLKNFLTPEQQELFKTYQAMNLSL